MAVLFASVLFLNAFLLFWVQPLFAKMVLPVLGGSPSVWTACMLFFQAALLAGYAYSHAGLAWLGIRRHAALHVLTVWLPLLVLPVGVAQVSAASAVAQPVVWLLTIVATTVGLPFVVLSATAPLLQRWFSAARTGVSDPYWLYAASNAGSMVALLAFPTLLEPSFPVREQAIIWQYGYGIVAALLTTCALVVIRARVPGVPSPLEPPEASAPEPAPSGRTRLGWLARAFAPSSLMLGVTTYISTDVASVPLLWVLPLACYLLTFIVAFGGYSGAVSALSRRLLPRVLLPLVFVLLISLPLPIWITIPLHITGFSVLSLLCHAELARSRPGVQHLTEFYLWLAAGGVVGGVFNTLVAPQIFTSVAEYPIAIAVACLLCVSREQFQEAWNNPRRLTRPALAAAAAAALLIGGRLAIVPMIPMIAMLGAPVLMGLSVAKDSARFALTIAGLFTALFIGNAVSPIEGGQQLYADRTFFGINRVRTDPDRRHVTLSHGTTTHGAQVMGDFHPEPLTYYHRESPIGQVFATFGSTARSVGVVGLGAGTLAAYVQPGDSWRFYEIDEAVERIARDTRFFRYLDRCGAQCSVIFGDARLTLAQNTVMHDVLVLDAFSSDSIPMHLLTTEALQTYQSRLTADGVLALHISNRHIRLRPVVARLARDTGLTALVRFDPLAETAKGYQASDWVVMARNASTLHHLSQDSRWKPLQADERLAWSDDFSNIWTELR